MSLPASSPTGYLPPGVHRATIEEIVARFGVATSRRQTLVWATEASGEEELASWLSVYQLSRDLVELGIVEVNDHD